jgi:hypothetical protein
LRPTGLTQWALLVAWLVVACSAPQVVPPSDSGTDTAEEVDVLELGRPPPRLPGPGRPPRGGRGRSRSREPVFNAEPTPEQREAARRQAENAALEQTLRDRYWRLKAEAEQRYPDKQGQYEQHHFFPMYLGGKENGTTYRVPAAYHQLITNAFRRLHPYGSPKPQAWEAQSFMLKVYSEYPIPQLVGIPNP